MTNQKYSSAKTSMAVVNKIYTHINFPTGSIILDYGGGKYDKNIEYMRKQGITLLVYDPYNRTEEYNNKVISIAKNTNLKYVVCSNVLNVIYEDKIICEIIRNIYDLLGKNGIAYFQFYEGDKSGIGKETSKGYQRNLRSKEYIKYIQLVFNNYNIKNGVITAYK